MNREIKFEYGFRSVNGIEKKVYALSEIPFISQKCDVWNVLPIVYVRQYTGLKDKNGKEIYEEDILATSNDGKNGHDEWTEDDWGYGIVQLDIIGGLLVNGWMSSLEHNDSVYSLEYVEVIGNIFENPELL